MKKVGKACSRQWPRQGQPLSGKSQLPPRDQQGLHSQPLASHTLCLPSPA